MPTPDFTVEHKWMSAAMIPVTERQARRAYLRHAIRLLKDMRVPILETYCEQCRRTYQDVRGEPCIAAETSEHLRGGPIGVRAKRKHNHNCALLGCQVPQNDNQNDEPGRPHKAAG